MSIVLAKGTRVADRYELQQLIGEGGMGSVWNARHLALDAPVAIKFVRLSGHEQERFFARFQREAKLAASVRHRNVVSITDYGTLPDGSAFMVMDYLEGEPFSRYLSARPPTAEMVYLMELTTRGLVAVHDIGIVHRDLKPENIFLVRDATGVYPKLIDFGISKHLRPEGERRSAVTTTDGAIVGTPAYMSPEQARGLLDVDQRTDIYSMGVILYEGLSGRLPYDSPYIGDLILAIVMGGATPLRELRPDLDARLCNVVMKAMAHDARHRYQTARELLAALAEVSPSHDNLLRSDRPMAPRLESPQPPAVLGRDLRSSRELTLSGGDAAPILSEPAPRQRPTLMESTGVRAAVIASVAALLLVGVWIGAQGSEPGAHLVTPASPPPAAQARTAATASTASGTHDLTPSQEPTRVVQSATIEVVGLPENALLTLDGRVASGTRFQLEKDGKVHTFAASAQGFAPWQRSIVADGDTRLEAQLKALTAGVVTAAPVEAPAPAPVSTTDVATPTPVKPAPVTPRPLRARTEQPGRPKRVITELDY